MSAVSVHVGSLCPLVPLCRYFTAQDGKVRRKNKQNLINVRIEEAFTK